MFWCLSVPRGPAGLLGQEEVEVKVQENFFESFPRKFWPESFPACVQRSGAGAERGGEEARQSSARKGPETEPTAAVRPPQALLPE